MMPQDVKLIIINAPMFDAKFVARCGLPALSMRVIMWKQYLWKIPTLFLFKPILLLEMHALNIPMNRHNVSLENIKRGF